MIGSDMPLLTEADRDRMDMVRSLTAEILMAGMLIARTLMVKGNIREVHTAKVHTEEIHSADLEMDSGNIALKMEL